MFRRLLTVPVLMAALLPEAASAHPAQFTTLQVTVEPAGQFQAALNIDILAYALGKTSLDATNEELEALLDGPRQSLGEKLADAGERFRREVVIHTDAGNVTPTAWQLPGLAEVDAVLARKIRPRILMPGEIDFSGTLPAGAHTVSIRLPYVLGDTMQVFELPNGDTDAAPVPAGNYSGDVPLNLQPPKPPSPVAALPERAGIGWRIIPEAVGCILFLAALYFLNSRIIPNFRKARFRQSR
jgi:hypothetical protein